MPKAKVEAVTKRIFERVFICMRCNARIRADPRKVILRKVKCRKCDYKGLRPKSRERKI